MRSLALAALLLATAAPALAETLECVAQRRVYATEAFGRFTNPIQERMRFEIAPDGGSVRVLDPLIRATYGGPIEGKVTENTDAKLVVTWSIPMQGFNLAMATMTFRASLQKAPNRLIVTAVPLGFQERFFARGGCARTG
jgi:hypothetical protein